MRQYIRRALRIDAKRLRDEQTRILLGQIAVAGNRSRYSEVRQLWDVEASVFSQWGEDGILDYLCEQLSLGKPRMVEFGAGNFTECNSRFLAENRCASVLAVDARPDLASSIAMRPVAWRTTVIPRIEWITPDTAPLAMQAAHDSFGSVDIVSLDIDGNDYWVAKDLPLDGVQVVVAEYNPLFGPNSCVTIPREDDFERFRSHHSGLYFGASLPAFVRLFRDRGFEFVGTNRVGNNAFFVRGGLEKGSLILPNVGDLSPYTDWRVRETRDTSGQLTFTSIQVSAGALAQLPLIDTVSGEFTSVAHCT